MIVTPRDSHVLYGIDTGYGASSPHLGGRVVWRYSNRTGDLRDLLGYHDGYLYFTDRKKDMLLVNGINVYPRELEEVIYQFDGVKEAAVIGVNDPRKGDMVVACVAPTEGAIIEDTALLGFLKDKLAAYKMPRKVMQMEALPRNATGKILKTKLREIAAEQFGR